MDNKSRKKLIQDLHYMQQSYGTLFSAVNKVQAKGDEQLAPFTSRQFMVLMAILHLPQEETTLINVANKLGATKQATNKLINVLKKKGFVEIKRSETDQRSINIVLTDSCKAALLEPAEQSIYFLARLFHAFSSDELKTFWRLLQKVYQFDGAQHDRFEEEAALDVDIDEKQTTDRILMEFARIRGADQLREEKHDEIQY